VIELVIVRQESSDRQWLENVYPLYLHDLSEFEGSCYTLNSEGRWQPDYLPAWFELPGANALLLSSSSERIGFALVGRRPFPYLSPDADQRLSEFFVLRQYRRRGLAAEASRMVLERFPGAWELEVVHGNHPALRFWETRLQSWSTDLSVEEGTTSTRFKFTISGCELTPTPAADGC